MKQKEVEGVFGGKDEFKNADTMEGESFTFFFFFFFCEKCEKGKRLILSI